jgi:hypothetical protein
MLIQDILKNTPEEHFEYEKIQKVLTFIEELTISINESKRKLDTENSIKELMLNFKGKFQISESVNRDYLFKEYFIKFSFPNLKLNEENYKVMIFSDLIALIDLKNKTTNNSNNYLFYYYFLKMVNIKDNEVIFDYIYNNNKETVLIKFNNQMDMKDALDLIKGQIELSNLKLLNMNINESFKLKAYERILFNNNLKNKQSLFEKSE